ncbi:hypothetical protein GOP47_0005940 [Adiantum capillus-veneris]|uniref:Uncharacterized protein n=1 Tax=Adiantum capillus-veneris TaxID=13818 RepID=A0A9D4V208_ADICA|nr:hypothetical protein GOP47_0005940 [Adiantum capillus-veneris]
MHSHRAKFRGCVERELLSLHSVEKSRVGITWPLSRHRSGLEWEHSLAGGGAAPACEPALVCRLNAGSGFCLHEDLNMGSH